MVVYHFIWDLDYFGWIDVAMNNDAPWVPWRTAIVTQFLLLVGVSLVLRTDFKPSVIDFWRRWLQVACAAAIVSIGSAWMFGPRFIFFGILHFVAAALLITRPLLKSCHWLILLGIAAIVIGVNFKDVFFTQPGWNILGWVTHKPATEDYVPLFPWLGVVWIGAGCAFYWKARGWRIFPWLAATNDHLPKYVHFLGKWPLTIYLIHQPILIGVLWAVKRVV